MSEAAKILQFRPRVSSELDEEIVDLDRTAQLEKMAGRAIDDLELDRYLDGLVSIIPDETR